MAEFKITGINRISTKADGGQANELSLEPIFSSDGVKVAFRSFATNLVTGDTNNAADLFVKELPPGLSSARIRPRTEPRLTSPSSRARSRSPRTVQRPASSPKRPIWFPEIRTVSRTSS